MLQWKAETFFRSIFGVYKMLFRIFQMYAKCFFAFSKHLKEIAAIDSTISYAVNFRARKFL